MMDSLAKMFRRTCNDCGSALVIWSTAGELALVVDPAQREKVFELIEMCGPEAEAWRCGRCSNYGVFGPTEVGF